MDDPRITTIEAAARLGVSVGRVRQLVLAGNLPAEKFGRDLMIRVSDLANVKVYRKRGRPPKQATVGQQVNGQAEKAKPTKGSKKATAKASQQ